MKLWNQKEIAVAAVRQLLAVTQRITRYPKHYTPLAVLSYICLSSVPPADSKQTYLSAAAQPDKIEQRPSKSLKKLSFTETNMEDFKSVAKIKEYLLQSAKKHHLLPSHFNTAFYKDIVSSLQSTSLVNRKWRASIEKISMNSQCIVVWMDTLLLSFLCTPVFLCIYVCVCLHVWTAFLYSLQLVTRHNDYRSKHGVGLLRANSDLERTAEVWAQRLASKADCLIHDPSKRFGENLFYYATDFLPDEETMALMTVQSFYLEAYGYNYKTSVTTKLYSEKMAHIIADFQAILFNLTLIILLTVRTDRFSFNLLGHAWHHHLDYHRTGHFTQLIWKSTKQMGVGVAMRDFNGHRANSCQPDFPSTLIYVVVKYDPPGNVLDKKNYDDNVLPPIQ
uniref:SCP domain-containing protein n=1 Tax=Elaeophora elaphi TaxID=1147741 RepID=A0A0R3RVS9_9BILA